MGNLHKIAFSVCTCLLTDAYAFALGEGGTWSPVGQGTNNVVYALTVYNGNLIAGGLFVSAGGQPANRVAQWNGTSWSPLGVGINNNINFATVDALAVYNGNLIAGGNFGTAGSGPATAIARWDGANWHPLGSGLPGSTFQS